MRWRSLADRLTRWLLPALAILAEGALLAVVYAAIQTGIEGRPPLLGTLELSIAAGAAAYAMRRGWINPDERPGQFLGVLAAVGAIGWLWDAEARALVLAGNPLEAVPLHPGGWLTLVAAMRGVGRGVEIDDRALTRLVLVGVPFLALPWALGQLASGDLRPVFTDHAFVASLTFVAAGFMAAGLARLQEIGRETGIDWRRDRSWSGTVVGVLVAVLALGLPASALLGLPGDAVARGILDPLLGLLGYLFVAFAATAALTAAFLARVLGSFGIRLPAPMTPEEIAALQELPAYTVEELSGAITGLVVVWIILAVVGVVLLRVWIRRRRPLPTRTRNEERSFRLPPRDLRLRPPALRRSAPEAPIRARDAVTAYLAALSDLARSDPGRTLRPGETPRSHARRVAVGPELGALQADYSLARYGERRLTDAEHRRALGRWRRLRSRLRGTS